MNKKWAQIVSGILYLYPDPTTTHLHIISSLLFKVMFCHVSGGGHFEVATTSSTHRNVANVSSPIRQEDASGRHDVASGRQCIVMKLSAIASGRERVVSTSSDVRLWVATGSSIGRQ